MRTQAFNEIGQKISEVDENDKIQYFQYDALGRMKYVLDEQRNILKSYEYNFKK